MRAEFSESGAETLDKAISRAEGDNRRHGGVTQVSRATPSYRWLSVLKQPEAHRTRRVAAVPGRVGVTEPITAIFDGLAGRAQVVRLARAR